jgi:hypothetical protein
MSIVHIVHIVLGYIQRTVYIVLHLYIASVDCMGYAKSRRKNKKKTRRKGERGRRRKEEAGEGKKQNTCKQHFLTRICEKKRPDMHN